MNAGELIKQLLQVPSDTPVILGAGHNHHEVGLVQRDRFRWDRRPFRDTSPRWAHGGSHLCGGRDVTFHLSHKFLKERRDKLTDLD